MQARFEGADLSGANLQEALLVGGRFQGATLKETRLVRSDLLGADFSETDMEGADLHGSNLLGASFRNADLRSADFKDAVFRRLYPPRHPDGKQPGIPGLEGALLENAVWTDGSRCNDGSVGRCERDFPGLGH
jgi:uncharacterized protein YjbI with pentapeptide repeats